jgi:TolA-binding protein
MHMKHRGAAALLPAAMLAALALHPHTAAAQSAAQLQAIESQINALQAEIRQMKLQMAQRDTALREAQAEASAARRQATVAVAHTQELETTVSHAPPRRSSMRRHPGRRRHRRFRRCPQGLSASAVSPSPWAASPQAKASTGPATRPRASTPTSIPAFRCRTRPTTTSPNIVRQRNKAGSRSSPRRGSMIRRG